MVVGICGVNFRCLLFLLAGWIVVMVTRLSPFGWNSLRNCDDCSAKASSK